MKQSEHQSFSCLTYHLRVSIKCQCGFVQLKIQLLKAETWLTKAMIGRNLAPTTSTQSAQKDLSLVEIGSLNI